ncbi:MAG TPA: cytochrome P450 [Acidimicrobiaceae bacterium]|nr:cytochrome P450 [Acidimicrobiaceae bacterium]HCB36961.1 cytochrome P450 [Acidimicrobiaceae bacterium]
MTTLVSDLELPDLTEETAAHRPNAARRNGTAAPDTPPVATQPATGVDADRHAALALEMKLVADGEWLARAPLGYLVLRHGDVARMLRDSRWHSAVGLAAQMQGFDDPEWEQRRRSGILTAEGDTHMRLRRIVSPAFTPRTADRLRPFMRDVVNELLDPVCERGSAEFVSEVCEPYPIPIICEMLGAPRSDWELFSRLAVDIFRIFNSNIAEDAPKIMAAESELDAYMRALVDERRKSPGDDLLSDMIAAESDGDRLSTDELIMMANALLLAGTDTTRNQLGCAVALLTKHPDQLKLLAAQPELAKGATEEVMRCLGAVRGTARFASVDIEYRDVVFPKGTLIFPSFSAANHDADEFADPLRFDITRRSSVPHMTFSSGIHYCLGAFLARAELAEALTVIARRMPGLRTAGEIVWKPLRVGIWGPEELPVEFAAGH